MNKSKTSKQRLLDEKDMEIFRLKEVIENLPGSIYWKDKNGVYLGRNKRSYEKMLEVELENESSKDSVIGKTDYDLFAKEVADKYREHDLQVMSTGKELVMEEKVFINNDQVLTQLSYKKPLRDPEGQIVGVVGNTVDITYLKEIEDKLIIEKEKAESANKIKLEFIRNMEHDIRTPFNGIYSLSNFLLDQETDESKKELLAYIVTSAKQLLDYCNSIIDYSRIELDSSIVQRKPFNIKKLLSSIYDMELPAAVSKRINFSIEFDKNIPQCLIGDSYRLSRILLNLIGNAIKFTEHGSVIVDIKKDSAENSKNFILSFSIKDTGIGIPEDKKVLIFEKFSKITESNKSLYYGLGLGLPAVKQFVGDLGGTIQLISSLNKGTEFICLIPFERCEDTNE